MAQNRTSNARRRTKCHKPATLDKGRRAFELRSMGWSFPELADELSMSTSAAHELYTAFVEATPSMDTEGHRKRLLATLDVGIRAMQADMVKTKAAHVRATAARTMGGLVKTAAHIAGVVKLAPVIVMAPPKGDDRLDLSTMPIADVRRMQEIRAELMQMRATQEAPALEAHGESSDEHERSDGGEGSGDSVGAVGGGS